MTTPTERRERAALEYCDSCISGRDTAFLAGCDWQHKTTIADVVAWLRQGAKLCRSKGARLQSFALDDYAAAVEHGEAEGAAHE